MLIFLSFKQVSKIPGVLHLCQHTNTLKYFHLEKRENAVWGLIFLRFVFLFHAGLNRFMLPPFYLDTQTAGKPELGNKRQLSSLSVLRH